MPPRVWRAGVFSRQHVVRPRWRWGVLLDTEAEIKLETFIEMVEDAEEDVLAMARAKRRKAAMEMMKVLKKSRNLALRVLRSQPQDLFVLGRRMNRAWARLSDLAR